MIEVYPNSITQSTAIAVEGNPKLFRVDTHDEQKRRRRTLPDSSTWHSQSSSACLSLARNNLNAPFDCNIEANSNVS